MKLAKHRTLFTLGIAAIILIAGTVAIFWARGFKPDFKNGGIQRTGLIVASSTPTGAHVYLDDRLTSATDTNIAFLTPKTYKVKIQKDGYTTWEKDIEIKADLAVEIKALLFPTAPEIKPLTITGAASPILSPDGAKIVYGVAGAQGGLYTLPMDNRPFPFRQGARLLAKNQGFFDFSQAKFFWSPESKQLIARFSDTQGNPVSNILVDSDKTEQDIRDVSGSLLATLTDWQNQIITHAQTQALTVPDSIKQATTEAVMSQSDKSKPEVPKQTDSTLSTLTLNYFPTGLVFSPDEDKVLYKNGKGDYKVYDLKLKKAYTLPNFADFINLSWFPDGNHLVIAQKDQISIIESDGTNKMAVYSGKFENGFVFAHPSGSRLIILSTIAQPDGTSPNLYSINLK